MIHTLRPYTLSGCCTTTDVLCNMSMGELMMKHRCSAKAVPAPCAYMADMIALITANMRGMAFCAAIIL